MIFHLEASTSRLYSDMPTIEESLRKKQSIFLNGSSKEQLETIYRFVQKFTTVGTPSYDLVVS